MKVKDVLKKYHKIVPFPWTVPKLEKAGYDLAFLFEAISRELKECEDIGTPTGLAVLDSIEKLIS